MPQNKLEKSRFILSIPVIFIFPTAKEKMSGQNNISKGQHEALRLWQEACDRLIRGWMTSPAVMGFNAFWFRQSLDFYEYWLESGRQAGFDADAMHNAFRANLKLFSIGTNGLMANVRLAQTAGILPKTAPTSAEIIWQTDDFRLLRYKSANRTFAVPLLIVSSLVGKYYILDLTSKRSYVAHLLDAGFDVFIIDWTTNEKSEGKGLNDYVCAYLAQIIEKVAAVSKGKQVSLLGYSMGGILALIYAALNPDAVKNLILLTTPVDFSGESTIGDWTSEKYFDVDRVTDLFGNISGEAVSWSMQMVKPASSLSRGINTLQYADNREDFDALMALEIWLHDPAPLPAKLFKDVIKKLYRNNLLAKNELMIGKRRVDLSNINSPVLNIIGTHDQVATPETSEKLSELLGNIDKAKLALDYGHLTIAVGSGAKEDLWQKSVEWLERRS
jgi:polyhydroxyalkanoate synthase